MRKPMQVTVTRSAFLPALALVLALGACAGPGAQAKPTVVAPPGAASAPAKPAGPYVPNGEADVSSGRVAVQMFDTMKFQANTFTNARPGSTITVELKNSGATIHSIVAPQLGLATKKDVRGGGSDSVTFTVPSQPGTYAFWCPEPGHAEAGMTGQVQVK
jgi:uncharacterized cupredoxin-like copper-binding protein